MSQTDQSPKLLGSLASYNWSLEAFWVASYVEAWKATRSAQEKEEEEEEEEHTRVKIM